MLFYQGIWILIYLINVWLGNDRRPKFKTLPMLLLKSEDKEFSRMERVWRRGLATEAVQGATKPVMPFIVPNTNTARNSKRYAQAGFVLRRWLREVLEMKLPGLSQALVPLFTLSDNLDTSDQVQLSRNYGAIKVWFLTWIASSSREIGALDSTLWDRRARCPTVLREFFVWSEGSGRDKHMIAMAIRFVLSWLDLPKVYTIPSAPSLEPITGSFSGVDPLLKDHDLLEAIDSLGIIPSAMREAFDIECKNFNFHESSAAGPNGHALWASHLDAVALQEDMDLFDIWRELVGKMGLSRLSEMVASSTVAVMRFSFSSRDSSTPIHSRLHCIFEKGMKARIIAIGDYFTQAALIPFMNMLKFGLSNIPQDYTYNQEEGFAQVLRFTKSGKPCYSLDLSKATDRLPLALQVRIMGLLLGDTELATLWGRLLSERDFVTQNGHRIRYAVGQPQGMKSSFHSMAITHHVIVMLAASSAGVKDFEDYVILGDDIVLTDLRVVKAYQRIMGTLGVGIAIEKSLFSVDNHPSAAEFCKRIAFDGIELTGIPMHLLANTVADPQYTFALWDHLATRGIIVGDALYDFFALFLNDLDYERLFLMNVLPQTVTGLRYVCPAEDIEAYSISGFNRAFGFSLADVEAYYYFVLVSDQLSKLDGIIRKASSFLSIALESAKLGPAEGFDFEGTSIHLSVAVQDKLARMDSEKTVRHPVQNAARVLGTKVVELLNAFSNDASRLPSLVKSGAINALSVSLDAQPQFTNAQHTALGNRRILDKAIRLLEENVAAKDFSMRSFIGKIGGVTQAWAVSVGLGKGLVIAPHVSVTKTTLVSPRARRSALLKRTPGLVKSGK